MKFNLKFFTMESFDFWNTNHLKALEKIKKDNQINKYFTNLNLVFFEVNEDSKLQGNYLVYLGKVNIGFIRLIENGNCLEIQYGIFEEFRRRKLSIALLNAVIDELKKYDIDKLVLYIKDDNIPSIKCANKFGFEIEKENIDEKVYSKKLR